MNIKQIIESIELEISKVKSDFVSGSTEIASNCINIIKSAAFLANGYKTELIENIIKIQFSKPSMASVRNICLKSIELARKSSSNEEFLFLINELEKQFYQDISNCIENTYNKLFKSNNPDFLKNNSRELFVLTCSYSGIIQSILQNAYINRVPFRIYILESLWHGKNYAVRTAEKLNGFGLASSIVSFEEMDEMEFSFGLVGSDKVLPDGSVINGVPSAEMAELLYGRSPFFVAAGRFKFHDEYEIEDGFELIESKYITEIIN